MALTKQQLADMDRIVRGKAKGNTSGKQQQKQLPDLIRSALPIAGSIAGGIGGTAVGRGAGVLGGPLAPVTSMAGGYAGGIGGAGLGGAAGQGGVNLIERLMSGGDVRQPLSNEKSLESAAREGATAQAIGGPLGVVGGKALQGLGKGVLIPAFGKAGINIPKLGLKGGSSDELLEEIPQKSANLFQELEKLLVGKAGMTRKQFTKLLDDLSQPEKSGASGIAQAKRYKANLSGVYEDLMNKNLGKGKVTPQAPSKDLLDEVSKLNQSAPSYQATQKTTKLIRDKRAAQGEPRFKEVDTSRKSSVPEKSYEARPQSGTGRADYTSPETESPLEVLQKLKQTASNDVNWRNPDTQTTSNMANQITGALRENIEKASGNPKAVRDINKQLQQLIKLSETIKSRGDYTNPSNIGRAFGLPIGSLSVGTLLSNPLMGLLMGGGTAALEKPEIALLLSKLLRSEGARKVNTGASQLLPRLLLQGGQ